MNTPNLFNYATSELSQDAFLLWLLDWANPEYEKADNELHNAAQSFVRKIMNKTEEWQIKSVKCYKQKYHIDVLAVINEEYALIIEDKTATKEHGKQIGKYSKCLRNDPKLSELEQICVYYKSGNESQSSIGKLEAFYEGKKLKIVMRKDVIDILSPFADKVKNPIFVDYVNHILDIENSTNSYLTELVKDWTEEAWQGFYMALERKLDVTKCNWGSGYFKNGFCFQIENNSQLYLYLEKRVLCVKAICQRGQLPKIVLNTAGLIGLELIAEPVKNEKGGKDKKIFYIKRKRKGKKQTQFICNDYTMADLDVIAKQLEFLQKNIFSPTD